jgi:DNA-binding protein HU-beta
MIKSEVISEIANRTGISRSDVQLTMEALFQTIKSAVAKREKVHFRGFGSFVNKKRARKVARNISRNTALIIEEHYIPSFKPSKAFLDKVKTSLTE